MFVKKNYILLLMLLLLLMLFGGGCSPDEEPDETGAALESVLLTGEGIYSGQIDNISVEIIFNDEPMAFELGDGVTLEGIEDGSMVTFVYHETEHRPVIVSIEALTSIREDEGIFVGWADSRSVEIETDAGFRVFEVHEALYIEDVTDGSTIRFSYEESGTRPVLLSVEVIMAEAPTYKGEGILVGAIDAQSVEIVVDGSEKVFALAEGLRIDHIPDGSSVIFHYVETDTRPVINSITSLDTSLSGEGVYVGQIDSHSIEIDVDGSFAVFELGEGIDLEGLNEGDSVQFTYREGAHRPLLLTLEPR